MARLFENLDSVLKLLAISPLGLITDVDGTISRVAPTPAEAVVSPVCHFYLSLLPQKLSLVAVISGRPVSQVKQMLGIEGLVYIGNHGLERLAGGKIEISQQVREYPGLVEATLQDLEPLTAIEGILFENKGVTASIHYRLCHDRESVRRQILAAVANSSSARKLRIAQGRMSVELRPPVEANKGTAMRDLVEDYHLRAAICLGDDLTDVDAFRAIHQFRHPDFQGLAIGVIDNETAPEVEQEADFTLQGVGEVEQFFKWLAELTLKSSC